MRQKIIFFDIDRTLFNSENFLENFYKRIFEVYSLTPEEIVKIKDLYHSSKAVKGYFIPSIFLENIVNSYSQIEANKLKSIFNSLIEKNLYEDSNVLMDINSFAQIAFFSKGDEEFQKEKIKRFMKVVNINDVHILPDKIKEIGKIFSNYSNFKIFLVDDEIEVLQNAKEKMDFVTTILMDRKKNKIKSGKIEHKVENLNEIINLIYE